MKIEAKQLFSALGVVLVVAIGVLLFTDHCRRGFGKEDAHAQEPLHPLDSPKRQKGPRSAEHASSNGPDAVAPKSLSAKDRDLLAAALLQYEQLLRKYEASNCELLWSNTGRPPYQYIFSARPIREESAARAVRETQENLPENIRPAFLKKSPEIFSRYNLSKEHTKIIYIKMPESADERISAKQSWLENREFTRVEADLRNGRQDTMNFVTASYRTFKPDDSNWRFSHLVTFEVVEGSAETK